MHTITVCPRCGKGFMYHQTDYHLHRPVAWDADTNEPCSFETICQDCHEEEMCSRCEHSFIDSDNEGDYGYEQCRFCGLKQHK